MPRGGLQIIQPSHLGDAWIKPYTTDFHAEDAATWLAITQNRTVCGDEISSPPGESSRFVREFLEPAKLRRMLVAPVKSPVIPGYDGALQVYRSPEQGEFSESEIKAINDAAEQLTRATQATRASRLAHGDCAITPTWVQQPGPRLTILNASFKPIFADGLADLDERVSEQLFQDARHRLPKIDGQLATSDRVIFPDSRGQNAIFRVVAYRSYPALGTGPVIFYHQMPSFCDWLSVRAADFAADPELNRLVPAMLFMAENYRRGPTLGEIAKHVHLSPFHFHRRFTELLGITPKHFQLECQIFHAKRLLFGGETELAEISKICGFAHQSHFTSRFKQFTGLTPTRWRKMAAKGIEAPRDRVEVH